MGEQNDTLPEPESSFDKFDRILTERGEMGAHQQRMKQWKQDWGYLPRDEPHPLDDPLARNIMDRARQRFAVDHTAATTHLGSMEAYTESRRKKLLQISGNFYLGAEYGMVAAQEKGGDGRGIRRGHDQSTLYMRSGIEEEGSKALLESVLDAYNKTAHETDKIEMDENKSFLVNSPQVLDRLEVMYGEQLIPKYLCESTECAKTGSGRTTEETDAGEDARTCKECGGTVTENTPGVKKIASGVYVLSAELNRGMVKGLYNDKDDVSRGSAMRGILETIGTTPSNYQAFKTVNPGSPGSLLDGKPLGNEDHLKDIQSGKGMTALEGLPKNHPAHSIAVSAVNMIKGLGELPFGAGGTPVPETASAEEKYRIKLRAIEGRMPLVEEAYLADKKNLDVLKVRADFGASQMTAQTGNWDGALGYLIEVEKKLPAVLKLAFESNKIVQDALFSIETIVNVMPSYVNDTPRYTQLFDLLMQEMQMVLSSTKPYAPEDFKAQAKEVLEKRAPSIKALDPGVTVKPFLVSSGMDALTTGFVAAQKASGETVTDLHSPDQNYFEVKALLSHTKSVKSVGSTIVANLNTSTPTDPAGSVDDVISHVKTKLLDDGTAKPISFILDVTLEQDDGGKTDLDKVFVDATIKSAIEAGDLNVVLCKSYQKYATLGTGKVMAGNVTVISANDSFEAASDFCAQSEEDLDFMGSDEGQMMCHLLETAADQEIEMAKHAAENAKFLNDLAGEGKWKCFNDGLPFLLAPLGEVNFKGGKSPPFLVLLQGMGLEIRESFSFQNSSGLPAGEYNRVNTGQESHEGLVEKFYTVGNVVLDGETFKADVGPEQVAAQVGKDIEDAIGKVTELLKGKSTDLDALLKTKFKKKKDVLADLAKAATPAAKMKILNDLLQPSMDLGEDDITKFKNAAVLDELNEKLGYVNNKIASGLMLANVAFDMADESSKDLCDIRDAFLTGGMPRVTLETQARLLSSAAKDKLQADCLKKPALDEAEEDEERVELMKQTLADIGRLVRALPYQEDRIALLKAQNFDLLDDRARKEIMTIVFDGLDRVSQLSLAEEFAAQPGKAPEIEFALGRLEKDHQDALNRDRDLGVSETLETHSLGVDGAVGVPEMSDEDIDMLRDNIQTIKLTAALRDQGTVLALNPAGAVGEIFPVANTGSVALAALLARCQLFLQGFSIDEEDDLALAETELTSVQSDIGSLTLAVDRHTSLCKAQLTDVIKRKKARIENRRVEVDKEKARLKRVAVVTQAIPDAEGFSRRLASPEGAGDLVQAVFAGIQDAPAPDAFVLVENCRKTLALLCEQAGDSLTEEEHGEMVAALEALEKAINPFQNHVEVYSRLVLSIYTPLARTVGELEKIVVKPVRTWSEMTESLDKLGPRCAEFVKAAKAKYQDKEDTDEAEDGVLVEIKVELEKVTSPLAKNDLRGSELLTRFFPEIDL
ncbi:hypothetical protein [Sedimentitalea sp.]|uniref:hypothetical protein n=1 Tax=Sedimentitalea sp. TaxID=2048915 RepID=UPI003296DD60